MVLIGTVLSALLALAATEQRVLNKQGTAWSEHEALRRYAIQEATPVKYDPEDIESFLLGLSDKLEDMPLPDDATHVFIRDRNDKQMRACTVPEDDEDSMEASANPDDVMDTVLRSFPDGKCAGRRFGEWYYQVCGNLAVQRSPFTVGVTKNGKIKVTQFRAHESLGVLGRDRRVSRHLASVSEPRYVEQTYYEGARCSVEGDARRTQTTVTFECNRRYVAGYVHIAEVVEENPCKYRLQLQSSDFCDNEWLLGMVHENSVVRCRVYFHPERVKPLVSFLGKYIEEQNERKRRLDKYMAMPENKAYLQRLQSRPDFKEKMGQWSREAVKAFDLYDVQWGVVAERERASKMIDYVMSELTWASMSPDLPYSAEEQKRRADEAEEGRVEDRKRLATIRNALEDLRRTLLEESLDEDEKFAYEIESYTGLLEMSGYDSQLPIVRDLAVKDLGDSLVPYYASWLDYLKDREAAEHVVVRPVLFPPNRKTSPLGSYILLESLVKSPYADKVKRMFDGIMNEDQKTEPVVLYDGELDESDLEEIARRFMQVYKEAKKGGDTLLFDLLDDEDFEY